MERKIVTLDNLEYFYEKFKDQSSILIGTQTLTDEQKAQVRNNIGVPSMEQLMSMYKELLGMINNLQNQTPTNKIILGESTLGNTRL